MFEQYIDIKITFNQVNKDAWQMESKFKKRPVVQRQTSQTS